MQERKKEQIACVPISKEPDVTCKVTLILRAAIYSFPQSYNSLDCYSVSLLTYST